MENVASTIKLINKQYTVCLLVCLDKYFKMHFTGNYKKLAQRQLDVTITVS